MNCFALKPLDLRLLGIVLVLLAGARNAGAAKQKPLPKFGKVAKLVQSHFASLDDYQSGDIIAKSDAQPIFPKIESLGWEVAEEKVILERVLADQEFLVTQLRSRRGKKLMRQVSGNPLIYDRMDRISQQSGGQQMLRDLPKLPDAQKAVSYMVDFLPKTSSGRTPRVQDYDKPTGRIYTQKQLVKVLEHFHGLARQKAVKSGQSDQRDRS